MRHARPIATAALLALCSPAAAQPTCLPEPDPDALASRFVVDAVYTAPDGVFLFDGVSCGASPSNLAAQYNGAGIWGATPPPDDLVVNPDPLLGFGSRAEIELPAPRDDGAFTLTHKFNVQLIDEDGTMQEGRYITGSLIDAYFVVKSGELPDGTMVNVDIDLVIDVVLAFSETDSGTQLGGANAGVDIVLERVEPDGVTFEMIRDAGLVNQSDQPFPVPSGVFSGDPDYTVTMTPSPMAPNAYKLDIVGTPFDNDLEIGQTYRLSTGAAGTAVIFADGFESGDTSAWSNSVDTVRVRVSSPNPDVEFELLFACRADIDGDNDADIDDINAFVDAFIASDPAADIDGDGDEDIDDINAFVTAFIAGC